MLQTKERKTRPYSTADYQALKTASRLAAELAGQSLDSVAQRTRLDAGTISRAGNPRESNFLPIDVAIDLDFMATDPVIVRTMARVLGFDLVPFAKQPCQTNLTVTVGHLSREFGELVDSVLEMDSDGKRTPNEARRVLDELGDVDHLKHQIAREMHGIIAGKR